MISAIVYSSKTGHTKQYAEMLSDEISLPWYDLAKGIPAPKDREIIYMGWLCAGGVSGYAKATKSCKIAAVCASGMSAQSDTLVEEIRKQNRIPDDIPVFYLQGGFDKSRLPLPFRVIMSALNKSIAARLRKEGTMSEQQEATYKMTQGAYSAVAKKYLAPVTAWYKSL